MTAQRPPAGQDEAYWREFLTTGSGDSMRRVGRRVFTRLPSDPRCRLCAAPFAGVGGSMMRVIGKRPSTANPSVCSSCANTLIRHHGGAEVEGSMLFADVRGSTALAEGMTPRQFHQLMERFYRVASKTVFDHDGAIDKFVGDELVAMFYPALSSDRHTALAIEAAVELLRATGHGAGTEPWVPVGAGVHTGLIWFGAVGDESHVELTALGDAVNTTARIAAAAAAGEVLVSAEAAAIAGVVAGRERRSLALKGKSAPVDVVVLGV